MSAPRIGSLFSGAGMSAREQLIEAVAEAIYNSGWEDGEPDVTAEWQNLAADDGDRQSAMRSARIAVGLPPIADAIDVADRVRKLLADCAAMPMLVEGYPVVLTADVAAALYGVQG